MLDFLVSINYFSLGHWNWNRWSIFVVFSFVGPAPTPAAHKKPFNPLAGVGATGNIFVLFFIFVPLPIRLTAAEEVMSLLCRPHLAHAPPPPEPAATSPQSHRRRHPHYPRLAPSSLMKVSLAQFNILGFPSIFYLLISSSPVNYALVLMSQVFTLTSWWCSILQIWWWR